MFKIYFKSALRQLWKNRLFSAVNITGLILGLASIMALMTGVYMYITTDSFHKERQRMYYAKTTLPDGKSYMQTTYPLLGEIVRNSPEVEAATHVQQWYSPWLKNGEKEIQENTVFVDTGFFGVFSFPVKYGNTGTALKEKFSVMLSEKAALALFGNTDPVGHTVTADDTMQLTVTAVLKDIPTNSTVKGDIFLTTALLEANPGFKNNADWYNGFAENFLKLKPGAKVQSLEKTIASIVALNYAPERKKDVVKLFPFTSLRNEAGPIVNVIISGSVSTAVFILLIILVNLLNLNGAGIYNRSKEVAVRQMVGGGKSSIIIQFCIENGIVVMTSLLLAFAVFFYLMLPRLNQMYGSRFGEISLEFGKDYVFITGVILLAILVSIVAGIIPASKLLAVKVSDAVKGKISSVGNSFRLRNIFITVQFILAIIFICITVILNRQIDFMKSAATGFNKDNVVTVSLDMAFRDEKAAAAHFETLLNQLRNDPHVKSISTNGVIPTAYWNNYNTYYDPATNKEVNMRHAAADAGFLPTFDIPVIQGRNFSDELKATEENAIMINRTAMNALGWTSAEGKQLRQKGNPNTFTVVGVMEDFHYQDMQQAIEPLVHWYGGKQQLSNNNYLSIYINGNHQNEVLGKVEAAIKQMAARRPFKYEFMTDLVSRQYAMIDGILTTTNFVALLTIVISCMGMFGLISLFARQRVKEIGVRKVLGASVGGIVALLARDFMLMVLVACVVALPVAWYVMNIWLQDFANHIAIQWWMPALSAVIALLIAFCTVGFQSLRAAMVNPVKSLRSE